MAWAPSYLDTEDDDVAEYLSIDDTDDDAWITLAISASSRAIDRHCRRQFGHTDAYEEREYSVRWDRRRCVYVADIDDLADITGLTLNGVAIAAPALLPANALQRGRVYERLIVDDAGPFVTIGADAWGWGDFPDTVVQAALLQTNRLLSRRHSPYGVAGSPSDGSEMRLLAKLDPDVSLTLQAYRRTGRAR